ncbi:MAG: pyridoxal phosphate-dependent aminotransferase [Thermoanaerobaculia bacterium]
MMRTTSSPYMEWAKTRSAAPYNLARSGVPDQPLLALGATIQEVETSGGGGYGWPPLLEVIARRFGTSPDGVVHVPGASMANFVAMAGLLSPGDDLVAETPTYELILSAARFLGASVVPFIRRAETGFAVDPEDVERAMTSRTRLIALTNLHNPSSARIPDETLFRVGELARSAGARVLVDEVYLESLYETPMPTAHKLGPEFLVTSSLTKAYGLSGLRCGWVLAEPNLARRLWRLNDLFGVVHARPAETLALRAFAKLPDLAPGFRALLEMNRTLFAGFLAGRGDISCTVPPHGTVVFPKLLRTNADVLCRLLREKYETSVVPGEFFGSPNHVRVGLSVETETFREGIARFGQALEELGKS